MRYGNFCNGAKRKLMEEDEEKYKENKMNFKAVYLKDSLTDLEWKISHPEKCFTEFICV